MRRALFFAFLCGPLLSAAALAADDAATVPNLSGLWVRSVLNLFDPPAGPGPIANTYRRPDGAVSDDFRLGDYRSPLLKPEAAEILKAHGEMSLKGKALPDPHNQCWPEPPAFASAIEGGLMIVQDKNQVLLITLTGPTIRHIRLNGSHPATVTPTWLGDSVGHYEGDTLVVDTIGIKAGPLAVLDRYGTPFSGALHVVERYRLIDGKAAADSLREQRRSRGQPAGPGAIGGYGVEMDLDPAKKGLQGDITVDDPGVFTKTWTGVVTYLTGKSEWPEVICGENLTEPAGLEKNPPIAKWPDF